MSLHHLNSTKWLSWLFTNLVGNKKLVHSLNILCPISSCWRRKTVFDLPLFRIFNQVLQIKISFQLDWVCFTCSFVCLSYFVWIRYCRILGFDYLTSRYILRVTNIIKEQWVQYLKLIKVKKKNFRSNRSCHLEVLQL